MASSFTVNCLTPAEVVETVTVAGAIKGNMRLDKVWYADPFALDNNLLTD